MKVLVTGSRSWVDHEVIRRELSALPVGTIVVHGACPDGADAIADRVARELGFEVRPYPAKWNSFSQTFSGHARNKRMVDAEHFLEEPISLCLAFIAGRAAGTWNCVARAEGEGIEVKKVRG